MRRALVVGINDYSWSPLKGCINDANVIGDALKEHYDGKPNFHVKRLTSDKYNITKAQLFRSIKDLFARPADIIIMFFSGHGANGDLGGYLVTQDGEKYSLGVSLNEIVELANMATQINEIIIILDTCYSGVTGNINPMNKNIASIREGVSILASSTQDESSVEKNGQGLFTSIILEAINGGGADVMGQVTVAGLYNYADKVLGPWQQRPVFKSHVTELSVLKSGTPQISFPQLRLLAKYFPKSDFELQLDPGFEPELEPKNKEKEAIFAILQKFRDCNMLKPIGEKHLYHAAKNSKACGLTDLGKLYWRMITTNQV